MSAAARLCALVLAVTPLLAAAAPQDPRAVAKAFSAALASGDETAAIALLDPQVLIYESGGQEASRDEYAARHLKADIAFMSHAKVEVLSRSSGTSGDLGWVATRSRMTGTFEDKPFDEFSTESLVLRRGSDGWRIVHIQWSSRPAAPRPKPVS
jgi:ketosteroid isomerase-like protein